MDSSLDWPTRLRFNGGKRGSTSESMEPRGSRGGLVCSNCSEYALSESLWSLDRPGTGGVASCKLPLGRGKYIIGERFNCSVLWLR